MDSDIFISFANFVHLFNSGLKGILDSENGSMKLHGLLHLSSYVRHGGMSRTVSDFVKVCQSLFTCIFGELRLCLSGFHNLSNMIGGSTTKYDDI